MRTCFAIGLLGFSALVFWTTTARAADDPSVTLQVRDRIGHVRSTQNITVTEERRNLSLVALLGSLATDSCGKIRASACQVQEIYRMDSASGSARQLVHSASPEISKFPLSDTLQTGDIIVYVQGGYCCGY